MNTVSSSLFDELVRILAELASAFAETRVQLIVWLRIHQRFQFPRQSDSYLGDGRLRIFNSRKSFAYPQTLAVVSVLNHYCILRLCLDKVICVGSWWITQLRQLCFHL